MQFNGSIFLHRVWERKRHILVIKFPWKSMSIRLLSISPWFEYLIIQYSFLIPMLNCRCHPDIKIGAVNNFYDFFFVTSLIIWLISFISKTLIFFAQFNIRIEFQHLNRRKKNIRAFNAQSALNPRTPLVTRFPLFIYFFFEFFFFYF